MNNLIELSFRNEKVFMTKNDITGLIKEDWFLKTILETNCFLDNIDEEVDNIEINEDKNTAMSLIESMRYNRLIVYPRVSMDYLLLLAEKWCIPENIIDMIKERIEKNINVNNLDYQIHEKPTFCGVDNIVFKCYNCSSGFKMKENKIDSCVSHGNFHPGIETFMCCGGKVGSLPCTLGYHVLNVSDQNRYLKMNKI